MTIRFAEYKHIIIYHNNHRHNVGEKDDLNHGGQLFDQFFSWYGENVLAGEDPRGKPMLHHQFVFKANC